jgi:hypothetical protein
MRFARFAILVVVLFVCLGLPPRSQASAYCDQFACSGPFSCQCSCQVATCYCSEGCTDSSCDYMCESYYNNCYVTCF